MCGISGVYSSKIIPKDIEFVQKMNALLAHRGPDDEGVFQDGRCALGHRRLAIIDLSKDGHQPFASADGRFILTYNGEIYNYIELREELSRKGYVFKTKTDTEVLINAFREYKADCLARFNGMFAFAIYDTQNRSLFLARDRFGIKPLYYIAQDQYFAFASEIKALKVKEGLNLNINDQALFDFLVFSRTDVFDETFYEQIKRLPKGHWMQVKDGQIEIKQWWDAEDYLGKNKDIGIQEINTQVERLVVDAVTLRLRSDVRVGSCLSGGLDSTILAGILSQRKGLGSDYATFSACFPGETIDESAYIDGVIKKSGFANYRTFPRSKGAFDHLKQLLKVNDEPIATASGYSQYEVMRLAKEQGVTVLLDGQGADESFAGYHYFHGFHLYGMWKEKRIGKFASEFLRVLLRGQDKTAYQTLVFQMLPAKQRMKLLAQSVPYVSEEFFDQHIKTSRIYNEFFEADNLNMSIVRHFQYKLEHLLRMEDRHSMAFSLEARVPYLDYRLVEFLLGVRAEHKIKAGETKFLQKAALGQYTTAAILNRKDKLGFATPVENWMKDDPWVHMFKDSYSALPSRIPGIVKKDLPKITSAKEKWKIIQLALWKEMR